MSDRTPDRLTFLRDRHGRDLLEAVRADPRNASCPDTPWGGTAEADTGEMVETVFHRYRDADPTSKGLYLQWLLRQALKGDLPVEDLPKARETLEAFDRYKRRLAVDQRDVGRHHSLADLWDAVAPFVLEDAPTSNAEADRREREEARAESTILLEQDGWTIAIPRTRRAASWWGRGTRWCTAGTSFNMFEKYNQDAPLVVFLAPSSQK